MKQPRRALELFPDPWTRVRIAGLCVLGLWGVRSTGQGVKAPGLAPLAEALGRQAEARVQPESLRWLPSEGAAQDMMWGRRALFVGVPNASAAPAHGDVKSDANSEIGTDVYLARIRVSRGGRALFVRSAHNLTSTPLGMDGALVVQGERAAFRSRAFGQVQNVSLLDLSGEKELNVCTGRLARVLCNINNLQSSGLWRGIGRYDVQLQAPARDVGLSLLPGVLKLKAARDQGVTESDLPWRDAPQSTAALSVEGAKHLPKTPIIWAVDTMRAVPWIGPEPIAWAEEKAFALKDFVRRTAYSSHGAAQELAATSHTASSVVTSEGTTAVWPPARASSLWKTPESGEGVWVEPRVPWVRKLDAAAPPAFYQTFVRPDTDRPYSKVLLVAMDTRQLELAMEGGSEDPEPDVGPTGSGHIPRDPTIARRVAAVWNGGFKSEHGHYGMTVNRRVLLPAVPGGASVITLADGRMGMGTWGVKPALGGIVNVRDTSIVSMRQNLDPLLEDGQLNPKGRKLWGYTRADNEGMQTHRSGMCITPSGTLMYAWGDDVNASALGRAMKLAGCTYGMHLDMNPGHTAFMFTNIVDVRTKNYKSALLEPDMIKSTERYIEWAQKDFFYVLTRASDAPGPAPFAAMPEVHADPSWLPAMKRARVPAAPGAPGAAGDLEVLSFDAGRVGAELELGLGEHLSEANRTRLLSTVPTQALFRCVVGNTGSNAPLGMSLGSDIVMLPSRADASTATLYAGDDGMALAATSELSPSVRTSFRMELPWLLRGGNGVDGDDSVAGALGLAPQGSWLLVTSAAGSVLARAAADTLRAYGVRDAVALSRGKRKRPHCGVEIGASTRAEETSLRIVATPARPMAFQFKPDVPVSPVK